MASPQEKVMCCLWLAELKSVTRVQRKFRLVYHRQPPTRRSIYQWMNKLKETGSVLKGKTTSRPRVSDERVEEVRDAFVRSPSKSIRVASRQLNMPISTVHKVLHKRLHLYAYKLQLLHHIQHVANHLL